MLKIRAKCQIEREPWCAERLLFPLSCARKRNMARASCIRIVDPILPWLFAQILSDDTFSPPQKATFSLAYYVVVHATFSTGAKDPDGQGFGTRARRGRRAEGALSSGEFTCAATSLASPDRPSSVIPPPLFSSPHPTANQSTCHCFIAVKHHGLQSPHRRPVRPRSRNRPRTSQDWPYPDGI